MLKLMLLSHKVKVKAVNVVNYFRLFGFFATQIDNLASEPWIVTVEVFFRYKDRTSGIGLDQGFLSSFKKSS